MQSNPHFAANNRLVQRLQTDTQTTLSATSVPIGHNCKLYTKRFCIDWIDKYKKIIYVVTIIYVSSFEKNLAKAYSVICMHYQNCISACIRLLVGFGQHSRQCLRLESQIDSASTNFFMQKATTVSSVPPTKTPRATPSATTSRIPVHPHTCQLSEYELT